MRDRQAGDSPVAVHLIDSHCHLHDARYEDRSAEILERASREGVFRAVTIGSDLPESEAAVRLAGRHPELAATVGIHPHEARTWSAAAAERLRELAGEPQVAGYGEIGLDYHYDFSPRAAQREAFAAQLALARELALPVVLHSREAEADTFAVLREHAPYAEGGVFHCFPYGVEAMGEALALGFHVGITGIVTFDKSGLSQAVASAVPADRLLLETDAPYLSPKPKRGQTNEPSYLVHVAREVARLRGEPLEEVARQTTSNAARLFRRGWASCES